jgi:hypothetical protein
MFVDYVPDDIVVLLHRMQHNFDDRSLFRVYRSWIPMANYSGLFKEIFDKLISVVPKSILHAILLQMRPELHVLLWRAIIASNDLLMITYDYYNGS